MADLSEILLLGDPRLYQVCAPVTKDELPDLSDSINKMAALVLAFRQKYGKGRGIAAPQIGVLKRLIVLNIDRPVVIINPILNFPNEELFELWDDCMSFPNLLVKLKRFRSCEVTYKNLEWQDQYCLFQDAMAELIQHEFDHLNGVLATQRAMDNQSFRFIN